MWLKEFIEEHDILHHFLVGAAIWILMPPFMTEAIIAGFVTNLLNISTANAIIGIYGVSILILVFLAPNALKKIWRKIFH